MTTDVKGDLFGRVSVRRTGTHVVDPKHLHEPFEGFAATGVPTVAYYFCRGCGLLAEQGEAIAQRLAREAGTPFDGPVPSGIYFETDGCPFCSYGQTHKVVVKPLPPLPTDSSG